MKGFFITGTDTNVGKTVVTAALARIFSTHIKVGVFKPVQTGICDITSSDAQYLFSASLSSGFFDDTYAYSFPDPVAPIIAAENAGMVISMDIIHRKFWEIQNKSEFMLVEGAGGLMVPVTEEILIADIAVEFNLPLIIIARPDLGTINHVLLTIHAARSKGLQIEGIIINGIRKGFEGPEVSQTVSLIQKCSSVQILCVIPWFESGNEQTVIDQVAGWMEGDPDDHGGIIFPSFNDLIRLKYSLCHSEILLPW